MGKSSDDLVFGGLLLAFGFDRQPASLQLCKYPRVFVGHKKLVVHPEGSFVEIKASVGCKFQVVAPLARAGLIVNQHELCVHWKFVVPVVAIHACPRFEECCFCCDGSATFGVVDYDFDLGATLGRVAQDANASVTF